MRRIIAVCVVLAAGCNARQEREREQKQLEAQMSLRRIGKNLSIYYNTMSTLPAGTAKLLPEQPCCAGEGHKCAISTAWQDDPVWREVDFQVDVPSRFQYSFATNKERTSFHAQAVADLDCDGTLTTYALDGRIVNGLLEETFTPELPKRSSR